MTQQQTVSSTRSARGSAAIALAATAGLAASTALAQNAPVGVGEVAQPLLEVSGPNGTMLFRVTDRAAARSIATRQVDGVSVMGQGAFTLTDRVEVSSDDLASLARIPGVRRVELIPGVPGFAALYTGSVESAATLAARLRSEGRFETVEHYFDEPRVLRSAPTDPSFFRQWHLINDQLPIADANVEPVWDQGITGAGVVIGIIEGGFQQEHFDLVGNYNADASMTGGWVSSHGTSVAGVAAAIANNDLGGAGAAYGAQLSELHWGIPSTAFGHRNDLNDIKSNSWGPGDNIPLHSLFSSETVALRTAVADGRGGLGTVFVWAAGNGGINDRPDYDGYASSRYTYAIGAVGDLDRRAWYNERGASMFAVAHSSGNNRNVFTTNSNQSFNANFGGTSSAAPLASGVIALMLEANPNLGWRDVGHVIMNTARVNDPSNAEWAVNGAGHDVNDNYGFGAIDAQAAVALAQTWTNVPEQVEVGSGWTDIDVGLPDANFVGHTASFSIPENIVVETVEVILDVTIANAGDLRVSLFSPSGTESRLQNTRNDGTDNLQAHKYTSFRHWGESSQGTWEVMLADRRVGPTGAGGAFWERARIRIYGYEAPQACLADWNESGTPDIFDILDYLADYNAGAPEAELTGDSTLTIFDILAFLDIYNQGCP